VFEDETKSLAHRCPEFVINNLENSFVTRKKKRKNNRKGEKRRRRSLT